MKYVIISDLHVKNPSNIGMYIDGIHESIYWPLYNLRLAAEYAHKNDATLIVAGDINDSKRLISQQVITETLQTLNEVGELVPTYIVLGNHDYELYNGKVYTYLSGVSNCTIVYPNDPIVMDDDVALIAYNYHRDKLLEDFVKVDFQTKKLIVSHFGLREGKLSGTEYRTGEFSLRDFLINKEQLLILGHYHLPQKVQDNVYYVGSAVPTRLNEINENKRFLYIDLDKKLLKSIPTKYPKYNIVRIGVNDQLDIDEIKRSIDKDPIMTKYLIEIDSQNPNIENIKHKLIEYSNNVVIRTVSSNKKSANSNDKSDDLDVDMSPNSILSIYLDLLGIEDKDQRKQYEEIFNAVLEIE